MSGTGRKLTFGLGAVVIAGSLILWPRSKAATATVSSCDPYVLFVKPGVLLVQYYRFDGAMRPVTPLLGFAVGHYLDSLGADHAQGTILDYGLGKVEIPLASGVLGADGYPTTIYPAPPIDAPTENNPSVTICGWYLQWNGPRAKPCPSGLSASAYSAAIKAMPQWIPPGTACGHFPTPTPTGGVPTSPTQTPSQSPTPTPAKPTIPPTAVPTATKLPCQVCIPCTPTRTPHIGPNKTPTKKAA